MDVATDRKAFLGVQALVIAYGLYSAKQVKERRLKIIKEHKEAHEKKSKGYFIQKVPSATDRWVDHPLGAWFIGNASVVAVALLVTKIRGVLKTVIDPKSSVQRLLSILIANFVSIESNLVLRWFVINKVYAHIPRFNSKAPYPTLKEFFSDYFSCNFVILIVASLIQDKIETSPALAEKVAASKLKRFKPLQFLGSLMMMRALTDFFFWSGHYVLHTRQAYWIHKKHHEHNKTRIWTNYHFSALDLFVEGSAPLILAQIVHSSVTGINFSPLEDALVGGYILGLEIESHAGKAIPTMSICPPISPLLTKFDDYNAWFHENHHNLLRCNYSITPPWDILFGTAKF